MALFIPGLALKADGLQTELSFSLGKQCVTALNHTIANTVPVAGVLVLLAQRFDNGIRVLRFGELAANEVAGEKQLDGEHQLFLNVHFVLVCGQLDEAVSLGLGLLIGWGAADNLNGDGG